MQDSDDMHQQHDEINREVERSRRTNAPTQASSNCK